MKRVQLLLVVLLSVTPMLVWAEDGKDPVDLYNLGAAHMNKKQYDEALTYFEQVVRAEPDNARALYNIGVIYLNKGQYDNALRYFERVVILEPKNQRALYNIGVIHMNRSRHAHALEYFKQVTRLAPDDARAFYNLGVIHMNNAEYDQASSYFEEVIRLDPNNAKALYNLGITLMQRSEYDRAAESLNKAARADPDVEIYGLVSSLAVASSKKPPVAEAAKELSAALGVPPAAAPEEQHQAEIAGSVADFKNDLKANYPSFESEAFKCKSDIERCKDFGYGFLDCELTMIACVVNSFLE
jgi:tetratricopeptide (TPR) repeat protein